MLLVRLTLSVALKDTETGEFVRDELANVNDLDLLDGVADMEGPEQLNVNVSPEPDNVSLAVGGRVPDWEADSVNNWDVLGESVSVMERNVVEPEADTPELCETELVPSVGEIVGWVRLKEMEVDSDSDALTCV